MFIDWDLGTCLLNECKRKQLLKPSQLNNWIDLRTTYRVRINKLFFYLLKKRLSSSFFYRWQIYMHFSKCLSCGSMPKILNKFLV